MATLEIGLSANAFAENQTGAVVGTLSSNSTATTYTTADSNFEIVGNQLKLKDGVSLDFETLNGVLQIDIGATDDNRVLDLVTVTFITNFGDVDEAPTDISLSNSTVAENSAGAIIGVLDTDDPEGDLLSFSLSGADAGLLEVDANGNLKLKDAVSLNFEAKSELKVTVSVSDAGATVTRDLTIAVTNVDEAPQLAGDLTGAVTRGSTYTLTSADLSFTDVDSDAANVFFMTGEVTGGYLTVGGSRERRPFSTKDIDAGLVVFHQEGAGSTGSFAVTVADRGNPPTAPGTFTISVTDPQTNRAPVVADDIADQIARSGIDYSFQIPAGSFFDPDGNPLSYSVSALPSWLSFNAQTQTFSGTADAGDAGTVQVTVTANDGSLTVSDTFSLTVTIPAGSDSQVALSNDTVGENSGKNTVVGELSATDDTEAPFTFALTKNPQHAFKIVGDELRVGKHADLDFETKSSYKIKILMTDKNGDTFEESFRIKLTDVEESPRGTKHKDKLFGDALDNLMNGKKGNDRLTGGDDADIFVLRKHYGRDVIVDFDPLEGDQIDLSRAAGIRNFDDLMNHHIADIGNHLKITAGDGSVLIIKNTELGDLSDSMFLF